MKKIPIFLGLLLLFARAYPQSCITDEHYRNQVQQFPALKQAELNFNNAVNNSPTRMLGKASTPITIPVVFHVFHMNGAENISKAQIEDQIRVLNEDFNRQNADTANTRAIFKGVAANCNITFRIATKDPQGNCTDGIIRYYTNYTENADDHIKLLSTWPTDRYLNIWVVKNIKDQGQQGTILGYAQFPWVIGSTRTDGVLIRSDYIGTIGTSSLAKAGRVATHEIGHWLGLYHPFQDSCAGGDAVDDTPPVASASFGCMVRNSCSLDNPDLPDMHENFMDYADGNCQNVFTQGQLERIMNTFKNIRVRLISEKNLQETGVWDQTPPQACVPRVSFGVNKPWICEQGQVTFTPSVYNGFATSYYWTFEGGNPAVSNSIQPTVTYSQPGYYRVSLEVENSIGKTSTTIDSMIYVGAKQAVLRAPFFEGFESPQQGWQKSGNNDPHWEFRKDIYALEGQGYAFVQNAYMNNAYQYDLLSPAIDFSSLGSAYLSFQYSYTPRNKGGNPTADRLTIYISTDCGASWQQKWTRAGTGLNTLPAVPVDPFLNYTPNEAAKWKQVVVNLNPGSNLSNVRVKFAFTSEGGNNLFLDNINMGDAATSTPDTRDGMAEVLIYPNPARDQLFLGGLGGLEEGVYQVTLLDLTGRLIHHASGEINDRDQLDLSFLLNNIAPGSYQLSIAINEQHITTKKILLQ